MKNEKSFMLVAGVMTLVLALLFAKDFVVDKISDNVVQKLQKEYSPSPYGPGLDPDKIDVKKFSQ